MSEICLEIDPGASHTAWGVVEGVRTPRVIGYGMLDPANDWEQVAYLIACGSVDVVSVEVVEAVHPVRRRLRSGRIADGLSTHQALALYEAGVVVGAVRARTQALGVDIDTFSAEQWRGMVVGDPRASDAAIERALRLRLAAFPIPRTSNAHVRDALGVALFGLLRRKTRELAGMVSP